MIFLGNFHTSPAYGDSDLYLWYILFGPLFVAVIFLSIVRIVSYMRWTGKYPFYFLFRGPRRSDSESTSNTPGKKEPRL
jgi:hypothetical protein